MTATHPSICKVPPSHNRKLTSTQIQARYDPREVELYSSQGTAGVSKEAHFSRQPEQSLAPSGQGYVKPNYHEMSAVVFFHKDKALRNMMPLKTGWILAYSPWRASELQTDAVNACTLTVSHHYLL